MLYLIVSKYDFFVFIFNVVFIFFDRKAIKWQMSGTKFQSGFWSLEK